MLVGMSWLSQQRVTVSLFSLKMHQCCCFQGTSRDRELISSFCATDGTSTVAQLVIKD